MQPTNIPSVNDLRQILTEVFDHGDCYLTEYSAENGVVQISITVDNPENYNFRAILLEIVQRFVLIYMLIYTYILR